MDIKPAPLRTSLTIRSCGRALPTITQRHRMANFRFNFLAAWSFGVQPSRDGFLWVVLYWVHD